MDPADLETVVDRELSRLPGPRAPQTLLPRVLTAVEAWSSRPWYTRAWFTWPVGWQAASLAALALLVAGGALLIPSALAAAGGSLANLTMRVSGEIVSAVRDVDSLLNAGRVLWRALFQPLAAYALGLLLLMCVTCAAFGTALNRLAVGRSESASKSA